MKTANLIFLILLGVAILYFLFPPKKINALYGYRTNLSMKNKTNWLISNKIASRGLFLICLFNLTLSLLFLDIGLSVYLPLFGFQILSLMIWIEYKLKRMK
ncbi:MAG: SdpI family protein [Flavobacteriaceae bacterium]